MSGITIYCDGLVEPVNPGGFGCWGWIAFGSKENQELGRDYGCLGRANAMSNNVAEYQALLKALRYATQQGWSGEANRSLVVRTDSQLVVNQVVGQWACQASHLRPLRDEARTLLENLQGRLEWVRREDNRQADGLTRLAYAQALRQAGVEPKVRAEMVRTRYNHKSRRMPLKPYNPLQHLEIPTPGMEANKDHQLPLPLF